jgi:hypothetical protein
MPLFGPKGFVLFLRQEKHCSSCYSELKHTILLNQYNKFYISFGKTKFCCIESVYDGDETACAVFVYLPGFLQKEHRSGFSLLKTKIG